MITIQRLKEVLDYDPNSGNLIWRIARGRVPAGAVAGSQSKGYILIQVDGERLSAHRIAWIMMTGRWPEEQIDHINLNRRDNRFTNLREATKSQNQGNRGADRDNTSGFKGVCWHEQRGKWQAHLGVTGTRRYLGLFSTREEAHAAYISAARKHFGEFTRSK